MAKNNNLMIGVLAVILLVVATQQGLIFSGSLIGSLTQVQFDSNDPTIAGPAWLVTFVQNGASQSVYGQTQTFAKSQLVDTTQNKAAQNDLTVSIDSDAQTCNYVINSDNAYPTISTMTQTKMSSTHYCSATTCKNDCSAQGANYAAVLGGGLCGFESCYCYATTPKATVGSASFDHLAFTSHIKAVISGTTYTGTISTDKDYAAKSVWLANGIVQAQWSGNSVSGAQCPTQDERKVLPINVNGAWTFADSTSVDNYKNAVATFDLCLKTITSDADAKACADAYTSAANSALTPKGFTSVRGEGPAQVSGATAKITLNAPIQYDTITMRIKAETLGVYVPSTTPQIVGNPTSGCFLSGSNGQVSVTIKNAGTVKGSLDTSISCTNPAISIVGTQPVTSILDAGATKTITFTLSGQTNTAQITSSCSVTVADSENPNNKATTSFSSCVTGRKYSCKNNLCTEDNAAGIYTDINCNSQCVPAVKKYACSNGVCSQTSDGTGTTDSTCGGSCKTSPTNITKKFSCVNNACTESTTGTLSEGCGGICANSVKYSCVNNACTASTNGVGDYFDSSCNSKCAAPPTLYKCLGTTCSPSADGIYTNSDCNGLCGGVVKKYKCDGNDKCIESADGTLPAGCNNACTSNLCTYSGTQCRSGMLWKCVLGVDSQDSVCPSGKCNEDGKSCVSGTVPCADQPVDKVCGIDGKTYDKACLAAEKQIVVSSAGACSEPVNWVVIAAIVGGALLVIYLINRGFK